MLICRDIDRAAPLGTGIYKIGGNYAASMRAIIAAHNGGYSNTISLMQKKKNMLMNADRQISLELKIIHI